MKSLILLAKHNLWANQLILKACSELDPEQLKDDSHGYGAVIELLAHLVQVEHAFFELAHNRTASRLEFKDFEDLKKICLSIDQAYVDYVNILRPDKAETRNFLVPWFGFEISLLEGVLQPLTHSHKHRADISMLLPSLGINGVEMDLIQWFAKSRTNAS
jgi:uncharacterized damage-inducible protein DinB